MAISSTGVFLLCQPLIKTEMSYKRETVGDAQLERIRSRAWRLDPSSTFFLGLRKKNIYNPNFRFLGGFICRLSSSTRGRHISNCHNKSKIAGWNWYERFDRPIRRYLTHEKKTSSNFKTHGILQLGNKSSLSVSFSIFLGSWLLGEKSENGAAEAQESVAQTDWDPSHTVHWQSLVRVVHRANSGTTIQTLIVRTFFSWHDTLTTWKRGPTAHSSGVKWELSREALTGQPGRMISWDFMTPVLHVSCKRWNIYGIKDNR